MLKVLQCCVAAIWFKIVMSAVKNVIKCNKYYYYFL